MPDLSEAYTRCQGVLKPQRQGTCGLYSFWFATLLVNSINTNKKPIVYPRKHEEREATGVAKGSEGQSLRAFAKGRYIGSGQGELLSLMEVILMVGEFKWDWLAHIAGGEGRKRFISQSFSLNRPVMFAHLAGGNPSMPITSIPISRECGPHWSLLIAETTDEYEYIDPNHPLKTENLPKTHILKSNEIVDDFAMDKQWVKPPWRNPNGGPGLMTSHGFARIQQQNPQLQLQPAATYNVDRRQALKNLLVAIY
jgi:hypothetical protein